MLFSVEQVFVERDEKRAPLKMPAWEATCSTLRAYLGWKHHEAPWSEYDNSTPPLMDERGRYMLNKREGLHSESLSCLEAPWSEYYNSTHHPTAPSCMEC